MRQRSLPFPAWDQVEAGLEHAEAYGVVRAIFPLRTITPVVGGGSKKLEPDPAEPVRLPAVRGVLRWWWRALFHGEQSAEELFAQEARLWGGVDVPVGKGREAEPSRVRLDVGLGRPGTVAAAGTHPIGQYGNLRSAPDWTDPALGYGLFPLQRSQEERGEHERRRPGQPLSTHSIRTGLDFRLVVSITESDPERVRQVLLAIWAWIRFGGLGARTRRGFGALELTGPVESTGDWNPPLGFGTRRVEGEWRELRSLVASSARLGSGARLLLGPERKTAGDAHGTAVSLLKTFRQGIGYGRRQGRGKNPGHSNWPEADVMRSLVEIAPRDAISEAEAGNRGVPRAAFGLPLLIKFKDKSDQRADATLVPTSGGRWSSPLILRPVATVAGRYRPAALFLGGEGPREVEVEKRGTTLPVRRAEGAKSPIRPLLDRAGGEALAAFAEWLVADRGFVAVEDNGGASS
jgi:CRISPR-associated protein Cmr1